VSGGPSDIVSVWSLSDTGTLKPATPSVIAIPVPADRTMANAGMAAPGGRALSGDGSTLYVVNNNANSVVAVNTRTNQLVAGSQRTVGFFP
jgi:DNA-binding beta-propeller fold protein YncE